MPEPFRPVLRGLLLTGGRSLYLRTELGPGGQREHRLLPTPGTASHGALWWPPAKVAGRYLTCFVAASMSSGPVLEDRAPGTPPEGLDLIVQAAEEDAAAGDHESAVQAVDDAEAWLGPLPTDVGDRRDEWRRLRTATNPIQRQIELVQAMVERAFAPIDAFFDLFEQSGSEMHRQADALSESARALEPAADLIRVQAELFERTVRTVGSPVRSPKALPASRAAISRQPVTGPWLPRMADGWLGRTVESDSHRAKGALR